MGSFNRIFAITLNTFREAVRDRILIGVIGLAGAVLVFTLALGELSLNEQRRVVEDLGLATVSLFSVLMAVFLGASQLFKEIDRKTLHVMLPKPIYRSEFLVGKHFGIVLSGAVFGLSIGAALMLVMGFQHGGDVRIAIAIAVLSVALFSVLVWKLRDVTSWVLPYSAATFASAVIFAMSAGVDVNPMLLALVLSLIEVIVLAALALFFGSFSSPFLAGAFTVGIWLIGRSADSMATMNSRLLPASIKSLLHVLARIVPNFNLFVPGRALLHSEGALTFALQGVGYGLAYAAVLLMLASLIFRRRDFP